MLKEFAKDLDEIINLYDDVDFSVEETPMENELVEDTSELSDEEILARMYAEDEANKEDDEYTEEVDIDIGILEDDD